MKKTVFALIVGLLMSASEGQSIAETPWTPPANPFTPPNFPLPTFDQSRTYNVKDFGATGQGTENDTAAIDKAIDKCNADGGGSVTFPAGTYAAASIHLKSNVRLQLDSNAVLFGMKD